MASEFEENIISRDINFYNDDSDKYDSDLIEFLQFKTILELRIIVLNFIKERKFKIDKNFFDLTHQELEQIIIDEGLM